MKASFMSLPPQDLQSHDRPVRIALAKTEFETDTLSVAVAGTESDYGQKVRLGRGCNKKMLETTNKATICMKTNKTQTFCLPGE